MVKVGSENFIRLIFSLVFASLLIFGGINSYKVLEKKASAQIAVTESINRWKQSYKALQSVVKEWNARYALASTVPDVRAIIALMNIGPMGLTADTDNLVLTSATQIQHAGMDISLSKICLGINGDSFIVKAATYSELLKGIDALAKRPDIYLGNITILGEAPNPQAKIGEFCVFLRNE